MERYILFLTVYFFLNGYAHAQDCCGMPDCEKKADRFAKDLTYSLTALGGCSRDMNASNLILRTYQVEHEEEFQLIQDLTLQYYRYDIDTAQRAFVNCVLERITNEHVLDWLAYFNKIYTGISVFKSPEFLKGWALHTELNQGAINLFKSSEFHLLTIRALLSYTIHGINSNAIRYRIMLGPALYYSASKAFFCLSMRTEIRLWDLDAKKATIGNVKLIVHTNTSVKIVDAGLGIGVELNHFGLQLFPFDYDFKNQMYSTQIGFFFRFHKCHHKTS